MPGGVAGERPVKAVPYADCLRNVCTHVDKLLSGQKRTLRKEWRPGLVDNAQSNPLPPKWVPCV